MSAIGRYCSLIPGFGVKLSAIILAGPSVLSAVGACPPHDGVRRRCWINVASAVSLMRARKKSGDLTTAIVPAGTSFPAVKVPSISPPFFRCRLRGLAPCGDEPRGLGAAGIKQDKVDHSRSRHTKGKDRNPVPSANPKAADWRSRIGPVAFTRESANAEIAP